MTHTDHQQRINLYIDNALDDNESSQLFTHLAECAECRTYMKVNLRVCAEMMNEEFADVPRSLDSRVFASVARENSVPWQRTWYAPVWFTRISIPLPAAASILFLIIVGSLLVAPFLSPVPQPRVENPAEMLSKILPSMQRPF